MALGASGQNNRPFGWARSLCSIGCFCIGSFFFSRVHRFFGPLQRSTLMGSFLLQSCCILVAAALVQGGAIEGAVPAPVENFWNQLAPIALLSFRTFVYFTLSAYLFHHHCCLYATSYHANAPYLRVSNSYP